MYQEKEVEEIFTSFTCEKKYQYNNVKVYEYSTSITRRISSKK